MSSMKCPQCGLVNWVTAEACKRCKLPFVAHAPATPAAAPPAANEQPPAAADEAHTHAAAPAETAPAHAESPQPYLEPQQQQPYSEPRQQPYICAVPPAQGHAGAGHARASWRSPYDLSGRDEKGVVVNTLDIDFDVAPFIDTTMTIRDTYALSRSHFRLIARVVLAAIAPHVLLILVMGAGVGAEVPKFPAGMPFLFGAAPPPSQPMGNADFAGVLSFFLLTLIAYHFVRWAIMPSALIYGLVTSLNTGESPSLFECYRWGLRRSISSGISLLLSVVMTLIGFVFLIAPGIYLAVSFTLVMPIAAIEGCGAIEVMRRSWNLSRGRRGTIFLSSFAWGALVFLFTLLATLLLALVAGVLRSSVVGSVATLLVTEMLGATGIVLSLVIYLGISHYGRVTSGNAAAYAPPTPPGDVGGLSSGGFVPPAGVWGPQPAFAAPGGYATADGNSGAQKTTIIALVACAVLILLAFLAIVASIAVPNLYASRRAANEASAISGLRQIASAEMTYNAQVGEGFADLDELTRRGLISKKVAARELNGYKFEVKVTDESFEVTATPVSYGSTGTRSFYISTEGVIRVADRRGLKARADDPPLNENALGPSLGGRSDSDVIIDPGGRVSWPGGQ